MRNWAMRFEAKHHYFKRLVGTINNFKNIELSLTRRHQALQAYLLQSSSGNFLKMNLEHGPTGKYCWINNTKTNPFSKSPPPPLYNSSNPILTERHLLTPTPPPPPPFSNII